METLTSTFIQAPLTFTQGAIDEIKRIRQDENVPAAQALRVGVKGGGCSGMSYVLGFDDVTEMDDIFEVQGVTMAMDKRHQIYLAGMNIDYQNGLNARGFAFQNPNAKETCGCGTSFSA